MMTAEFLLYDIIYCPPLVELLFSLSGTTLSGTTFFPSLFPALRIHCSPQCRLLLQKLGGYTLEERGLINIKVNFDPFLPPDFHPLHLMIFC